MHWMHWNSSTYALEQLEAPGLARLAADSVAAAGYPTRSPGCGMLPALHLGPSHGLGTAGGHSQHTRYWQCSELTARTARTYASGSDDCVTLLASCGSCSARSALICKQRLSMRFELTQVSRDLTQRLHRFPSCFLQLLSFCKTVSVCLPAISQQLCHLKRKISCHEERVEWTGLTGSL